ncbi:MAG: N-acetylmuramoyl-L-alanine amidase [Bacteroidales bacterium]|jgi:N-acetylmuramoyl-L-alanine amidase|nr:N-acetylmuramoyl-L-alanine amidase [Bacteroidales bacterium]
MKLAHFVLILIIIGLPTLSNAQQKEVIAEKGDGIYKLLTRNGLSFSEYNNAFIELNKNKLGKNNTLLAGTKYALPDVTATKTPKLTESATLTTNNTKTVKTFDIFGAAYKDVEITGNELNGAVYYLVSGHGGPDPGAIGKYGNQTLCEDEYAYDVTLRLARSLIQQGATVYMITIDPNDGIRDDNIIKSDNDEVCYPNLTIPLNQLKRLKQRTDAVNNLYNKNKNAFQRMICIHVDSRSHGENIDVFFYHDRRSNTGEKTARILQKTFQDKYNTNQPGRGYKGTVSARNLYELQNSYPVAVFIELGNINHLRDQQRFIIANNRQALANWLLQGLITDFQTNK